MCVCKCIKGKLNIPLYHPPVVRRDELLVRWLDVRLLVLNLNLAGTTLAAESLASNVITQAATTIKPAKI